MTYDAKERARVRNPILLICVLAWFLILVAPASFGVFAHCPVTSFETVPFLASFHSFLVMNPPAHLVTGWALMLVAMMAPVLIAPIRHIRHSSFTHRRSRSITLFITGYAVVWMACGCVLLTIELAVKLLVPQSYLQVAGVALIALVWQFSPIKQRCLNRCHAHPELAAFSRAADVDAVRFGATHGIWCAASCWLLMLFAMLLPQGHLAAMAAVAALIFSERLEQPSAPCWHSRGIGKLSRIVTAQTRIRLRSLELARFWTERISP